MIVDRDWIVLNGRVHMRLLRDTNDTCDSLNLGELILVLHTLMKALKRRYLYLGRKLCWIEDITKIISVLYC